MREPIGLNLKFSRNVYFDTPFHITKTPILIQGHIQLKYLVLRLPLSVNTLYTNIICPKYLID